MASIRQDVEPRPILDLLARPLALSYLLAAHGLRWRGTQNVPPAGPAILAANHQSFLDPVILSVASPRRVVFLAWDYYYNRPLLGRLMRLFEPVPVDVDAPEHGALTGMLGALEQGRLCGVFPEGGRTADGAIGPCREGVAALVLRSGAPVVPVSVCGAFEAWPVGQALPLPAPISVLFGRPLDPRSARCVLEAATPRERRRALTREVMMRVAGGLRRLGRPDLAARSEARLRRFLAPRSAAARRACAAQDVERGGRGR